MDGFCELCNREVEDPQMWYCYGCGAVVCEHCTDQGTIPLGSGKRHEPEDHLASQEDLDEWARLST